MRHKAAAAMDWALLAANSHSQTAIAIREKLQQQEYREAMHGLFANSSGMIASTRRLARAKGKSIEISLCPRARYWTSQH